jgi:hypothetical protein
VSNRRMRHLTGKRLNKKQKPQVLREAKPWHSRVASPTYSEALNSVRRADNKAARAAGMTRKAYLKRQRKERHAVREQTSDS